MHPLGEGGVLLEAPPDHPDANAAVLALAAHLDALNLPGVLASTPAIRSLLVIFDPLVLERHRLADTLRQAIAQLRHDQPAPGRTITIPVRYGGQHGPDLPAVAASLGCTPAEVVVLHTSGTYRVMMVGFAPGFGYIGPLPPALTLPRRATPRAAVPAGSVAIAAGLTGVYPARLPGGWHLIGHTSLPMFQPTAAQPSTLLPGDNVQFVAESDVGG